MRSGGLVEGRLVFVMITPSTVSTTEGVEPCHDFPLWMSMVLGELLAS